MAELNSWPLSEAAQARWDAVLSETAAELLVAETVAVAAEITESHPAEQEPVRIARSYANTIR